MFKIKAPIDFATYAKHFTYETSQRRSQYLRERLSDRLAQEGEKKSTYLEVGFGPGATVCDLSRYFEKLILVEPNSFYVKDVKRRLDKEAKSLGYTTHIFEDFFCDRFYQQDKFRQQIKDGVDLFVASQFFWYLHPDKWSTVLDQVYTSLSAGGTMVITMTSDDSTSGNFYRRFEPEVQMANHIIEHFETHPDLTTDQLKLEVWREPLSFTDKESVLVDLFLFYSKSVVETFSNTEMSNLSLKEFSERYRHIVAEEFQKAGFYTGDFSEDGEELIEYQTTQCHIVVKKAG